MSFSSPFERLIKLGLSLAIAGPLSAPAFELQRPGARPTLPVVAVNAEVNTGAGGLPVTFLQTVINGRRAYVSQIVVPDEVARATFHDLARANPNHFTVGVKNSDDEVAGWARAEGVNAKNLLQVTDDLTELPSFKQEKDAGIRAGFVNKIREVSGNLAAKKANTVLAITYAGTVSIGEVFWVSGSVAAASKVFLPLALFSIFTATQGDWARFMRGVGQTAESGMAAALKTGGLAREMNQFERRVVRGTGQFAMAYAISVTEVTSVTYMAGLHVDPVHIAVSAFAFAFAAADPIVVRWVDQHIISHKAEVVWFGAQYLGGALAAVAMYKGVSEVQVGLSIFVAAAASYLAVGEYVEGAVRTSKAMVKYSIDAGRAVMVGSSLPNLKRRLAMARVARQISKTDCNSMLVTARMNPWTPSSFRPLTVWPAAR